MVGAVTALDLASKWAAFFLLDPGERREIVPCLLWFVPSCNPGGAFSLGQSLPYGNLLLLAFAPALVGILVWLMARHPQYRSAPRWAFALVISGAAGNAVDRACFGFVRDFIQIPYWPVFNVADIAITAGAVALFAWGLFAADPEPAAAPPDGSQNPGK